MIDLIVSNAWLLGAVLILGILSARWAFPNRKAKAPPPKQEDEAAS